MFYTYVQQIGDKILHRWIDNKGKAQSSFTHYAPTLYVPGAEDSPYRGIRGEWMEPVKHPTITEARDFIKGYEGIHNFPIYGNTNWWAQFIQEGYMGDIEWDLDKLTIANLDIECLIHDPDGDGGNPIDKPWEAVNRITAITVETKDRYIVFGSKEYTGDKLPQNAKHIYCETEFDLLFNFIKFWKRLEADIITGWNINYFDIPYLIERIRKIVGNEYVNWMGPVAMKYTKRVISTREYGDQREYKIHGVSCMDYLEMYKKFTYKMRERYSLDFIAYCELGERKLDYSEYGNLDALYEQDYNKYIDYNIRDVEIVKRLDNKLQLMMLVCTLTYMCHIRHEDVFSQVRMWDTLIFNKLLEDNVVVPPKSSFSKDEKYEGAYVRDPEIGMHDWVVSFDLDGLYPHLMMQYNISPEMILDREPDSKTGFTINELVAGTADLSFLKDERVSMSANKAFFKRDKQGFLPEMMESLYNQRKGVKRGMLDAQSDVELIKGILKERGEVL